MANKLNRKLDLSLVEQAHGQYSKIKQVDIPVTIEGKTQMAVLEIDEVFSPSKIRECIEEFVSRLDTVRKINENHLQEVMEAYLIFLMIKHFTSFPAPKEYVNQVKIINMLIETGLLYKIYAEFDAEQINKVMEEVQTVADTLDENLEDYLELAKRMGIVDKLKEFDDTNDENDFIEK